jgi:hypothetical protein
MDLLPQNLLKVNSRQKLPKYSKDIENDLKELAGTLPMVSVESVEKHWLKGSEILEWQTIDKLDGVPIDPEKEYIFFHPVLMAANHFRRLKKAWKKNSINGVIHYLNRIEKLANANTAEQTL